MISPFKWKNLKLKTYQFKKYCKKDYELKAQLKLESF